MSLHEMAYIFFGHIFPLISQKVGHNDLVMVHDTLPCHDVLPHQFCDLAWNSIKYMLWTQFSFDIL